MGKRSCKCALEMILMISIAVLLLPMISQPAIAHSPSDMDLDYDFLTKKLDVTITHSVANPNEHYVASVEILKNNASYLQFSYTSQPSLSVFTYTYDVDAADGDSFAITATCSIAGSINREIVVSQPAENEIVLTIIPEISEIDENDLQAFTVTASANGAPLDDVSLEIHAKLGSASSYQSVGVGIYNFTYTAPDVNEDLGEVINISAKKAGYTDGKKRLGFTVIEVVNTGGNCPATLDGLIEAGEYDFSASFGGGNFRLHWRMQDNAILMAMEGKTSGWVAVGFDPENRMEGADMVFGWITDTKTVSIADTYATGPTGPHPRDTNLGGTSDILCYGGMESGGRTIVEFKRLLSTGDTKDKNIPTSGELTIIWALGPSDDFESQHSERGAGKIDFKAGTASEIQIPSFWIVHASLLVMGFVFMIAGIVIAKFFKSKKWWMKTHKRMTILGSILSIVGIVLGFIMVSLSSGMHFRVPHAYVGVLAGIFAVLTLALGFAQFRIKKSKNAVRAVHRWSGRIAMTLMLINILFGISLVI